MEKLKALSISGQARCHRKGARRAAAWMEVHESRSGVVNAQETSLATRGSEEETVQKRCTPEDSRRAVDSGWCSQCGWRHLPGSGGQPTFWHPAGAEPHQLRASCRRGTTTSIAPGGDGTRLFACQLDHRGLVFLRPMLEDDRLVVRVVEGVCEGQPTLEVLALPQVLCR